MKPETAFPTFSSRAKAAPFSASATDAPITRRICMRHACDRLENSGGTIAVIAPSLGYESEGAFSTAFKRVMGCAPRQYGRRPRPIIVAPSIDDPPE
ncbi:helix-turn-helix domain-containing protein [Pseudochelatococcus sp. B33]